MAKGSMNGKRKAEGGHWPSKKAKVAVVAVTKAPVRGKGSGSYVGGRFTTGPQGPEQKIWDLVATAQTCNTTTPLIVSLLAGIAQGTSSSTRVGDKILVKSLNVKLNSYVSGTTTGANAVFFHWSIVLDKQPDGSTASVGGIYSNDTSNLTQLSVNNIDRFTVLATGHNQCALNTISNTGETFERYIPLDVAVRFPDSTSEAITNGLYFVVTANTTLTAGVQDIDYDIRVRYADM